MLKPFRNSDLLPISEAYRMIYEDAESKNRHAARSWIRKNHPEALNRSIGDGIKSDEEMICREIAGLMDNVKLADYKFLQGLARIYFTDMKNRPNDMVRMANKLNGILKIISTEPHLSEYDRNLNGLSFKELDDRFSEAVKKNLEDDKANVDKGSYIPNTDYEIVKIKNYKDAMKYGRYTSWCVTHSRANYNMYTRNGFGLFYFCLKKGFKDVPNVKGEGCPLDEYGLSMIAVLVGDDGSLWHCTCRWNHANGGNDNIMDTQQISELLGVNFYDTFKPRSPKELMAKYKSMRIDDDVFCRKYGYIKIEEMDEHTATPIRFYVRISDGTIEKLRIVGDGLLYDDVKGFIKIDDGPYTIYEYGFTGTNITDITIPDGVVSIDKYAFYSCSSLRSIYLPSSIARIDEGVFCGCRSLSSIKIPSSVTSIGQYAFSGCSSLTSITIPSSVTSIGNDAFFGCHSLTSITIPSSVTSIGNDAFFGCHSLTSITIPSSVTSIGNGAFADCSSLSSITIPSSITSIGNDAFSWCDSLTSITIPSSITSIGNNAFSWCDSLTSITIPSSVTSIGDGAFFDCCSLSSITIPSSVASIGDYAFHDCINLKTINASPKIRKIVLEQIKG